MLTLHGKHGNGSIFWSLEDIVRHFKASEFAALFTDLKHFWWCSKNWQDADEVPEQTVQMMKYIAHRSAELTKELQLRVSYKRAVGHFHAEVFGAYGRPQWGRLRAQIETLLETLESELAGRRFASVSTNKSDLLESIMYDDAETKFDILPGKTPDEIWLRIWRAFPSLREECEEAVYCYVLERNTACVFHSMRVAEVGLRAFARRVKVQMPKGKKIEWAQWQEVLREIRKKIDLMGQSAKPGPVKDDLMDFYNGAYGQFMGFKDEFRNQVMHVRRSYDEHQAASALIRVRDFMGKLANKIDENGKKVQT